MCQSACVCACVSLCVCMYISVCLCLSVCVSLSVCVCVCQSVFGSVCVGLCICLSVFVSVSLLPPGGVGGDNAVLEGIMVGQYNFRCQPSFVHSSHVSNKLAQCGMPV